MRTLIVVALFLLSESLFGATPTSSVIQIFSYAQRPDFDSPWKKPAVRTNRFLGTLIGDNRILVSAFAVAYAKVIEGSRFGDSRKFPLEVEKVDFAVNLAVLKAVEPHVLDGMMPLPIGDILPLGEQATLWSNGGGERLVEQPVRVREVDVRRGGTSPYLMTHYSLEARQTSGLGWAEPVLLKDKLVALAVGQSNAIIYALPSKVMRHFLIDLEQPKYRGFVRLGLTWRNLQSPDLRNYLGSKSEKHGVMVTEVAENSPFAELVKPRDIVLKVDNIELSDSGYYQHPLWGRVHFVDRIGDYYAGDEIRLTIVRNGKKQEVATKAAAYDPLADPIPEVRGEKEPHIIFGGLLFQELSKGYLESWGDDWAQTAPEHLLYKWMFHNKATKNKIRRFVVLNRVLADAQNKGYEKLANLTVNAVNGKKVESLQDVDEALRQPVVRGEESFAVIELGQYGGTVILSYKELAKSHLRIAKNYAIPNTGSFFSALSH